MKKYLLIVWGLLMSVNLVWAQGSPLTLKEVVGYAYSPQYIYGVRSMNDGERYTQLSPDHKKIIISSKGTNITMKSIMMKSM